jgi:hypothetical protein
MKTTRALGVLVLIGAAAGTYLWRSEPGSKVAETQSIDSAPRKSPIRWETWSAALFERAKAQDRFVLLDLEAVWCHWCHVMDASTYSDPKVVEVLEKHYITVRVDQDSRPDLANRYEQYGWPATVIFGPDGTEIVKRRGYQEPDVMLSILEEVVKDPSPVPGIAVVLPDRYAAKGTLPAEVRTALEARHREAQDSEIGGLDGPYRYLPWEALEYAIALAREGDAEQKRWAELTLRASLKLIDPVWGGGYQYSVQQSWDHPHFEKIMPFQSENLRVYALAQSALGSADAKRGAAGIRSYVSEFLTAPNGAFYTSQDADAVRGEESTPYFALDRAGREARGIPRVDKNQYARENGWMIEALAASYEFTGNAEDLEKAQAATKWVLENRALPDGGFRHGEGVAPELGGPFLGDSLAMGRAFLQLHRATGERSWLARARAAVQFSETNFRREAAGYTAAHGDGTPIEAIPQFDENMRLVRFANLLHHYTGEAAYREIAEHAYRYIATEQVYGQRVEVGGILLADRELAGEPLHIAIVGPKNDRTARELHAAALRLPSWYKRVDWWDRAEGPLPNPDIQYPKLDRVAAFVCGDRTCSRPLFAAEEITRFVERSQPKGTADQAKN